MAVYDFTNLTRQDFPVDTVKRIINEAGFDSKNYTYKEREHHDGWVVTGTPVMALTSLRNAAKDLGWPEKKLTISSPSNSLLEGGITSTDYQVTINMSTETVQALHNEGFRLYGFKAVQSSVGGGQPLIWFYTDVFSTVTQISWSVQYQAYTSKDKIIPGGHIVASFPISIDLGQTLEVENDSGTGEVKSEGKSTAISIHNTTKTPFTCGISEVINPGEAAKLLCAFPLHGNGLDVIAPVAKVLLMFATDKQDTGTVIEQSFTESVLIDLTADNQRTVGYHIDNSWDTHHSAWAKIYKAQSNMASILIDVSQPAEFADTSNFERHSLVLG